MSDQMKDLSRIAVAYEQNVLPTSRYASIITNYSSSIRFGRDLRDEWIHQYAILPGAINTFVQVASSREWMVLGTINAVGRAVDRLNNSFFVDGEGLRHQGWEQLVARMCNDWLTVGRAMFHSEPITNRDWTAFEYLDPTYMYPLQLKGNNERTTVWDYKPIRQKYAYRRFPQEHVKFMDNIRIGQAGAILGSVAYLLPTANLDWLIRQHDTYQLDGRKLRDIIMVYPGMTGAIQDALLKFMAISNGEDPSKNGIPIIEITPETLEFPAKLQDMIARIGISEIPREFSRQELESRYVREISAALGLSIGQFYQDNSMANRSLEQVQQERATLKGPAYFIRSLIRMINNSQMMGTTPGNRAVLQVEEETDSSSMKLKAESFKITAEAMNIVNTALITTPEAEGLSRQELMGYFQRGGYIPPNMTLKDIVVYEENSLQRNIDDILEKGQIRMNLDGVILERRNEFQISTGEIKIESEKI